MKMKYLLLKVGNKKLANLTKPFKLLYKGHDTSVILTDNKFHAEFFRKASSSKCLHSLDHLSEEVEKIMKRAPKGLLYIAVNSFAAVLFVIIVICFLFILENRRKTFLESSLMHYEQLMTFESKFNINNLSIYEDLTGFSVVLRFDDKIIPAYNIGHDDIFLVPFLKNLRKVEEFNYRDIFLTIMLEEQNAALISIFENNSSLHIGKQIFVISHPYGFFDTKTGGMITGISNDSYGHRYFNSNIALNNEMLGGIVIDSENRICGMVLPVYTDIFSKRSVPGIFEISFLKSILRNANII